MRRSSPAAPRSSALDAALRLLARRSHSRQELAHKLARRGYADDEVAAVLGRLANAGYIDDSAFATALVRRRSGARGAIAIAAELRAKGISRADAEAALAALDPDVELVAATRLAGRAAPTGDWQAVAAKLSRRGYRTATVAAVMARLAAERPSEAGWKNQAFGIDHPPVAT